MNHPVTITTMEREELEAKVDAVRSNLDLIPRSVKNLRIVTISDWDIIPCAGTHVRNTSELGRLKITKKESKGKDKERITYSLEID